MQFYFVTSLPEAPERALYEHQLLALAEGLLELGHDVSGRTRYGPRSDASRPWVLPEASLLHASRSDVVLVGSHLLAHLERDPRIAELLVPARDRDHLLVAVDGSDGIGKRSIGYGPAFRHADLILKCHYVQGSWQPAHTRPWAFGITNRQIEAANHAIAYERRATLAVNFRVAHDLRTVFERALYPRVRGLALDRRTFEPALEQWTPYDREAWRWTGRRHDPAYVRQLAESRVTSAVGGYLGSAWDHHAPWLAGAFRRLRSRVGWRGARWAGNVVWQFDSWRFWEAMLNGSVPVHVDLDAYGAQLPVQPTAGHHYVGVNLAEPEGALALLEDEDRLAWMASEARAWVVRHYAPVPTAERFLEHLANLEGCVRPVARCQFDTSQGIRDHGT